MYLKINKQTLFLFIVLTLVGHACLSCSAYAGAMQGRVVEIIDGDTFVLMDDHRDETHVRLLGIDAPEKDQTYGDDAKRHLSRLIFGEEITVLNTRQDRYGRTLGRVVLDGEDIGLTMIRDGYAWAYKAGKSKAFSEYAPAQKEAKLATRGLWQQKRPTSPSRWRHRERHAE